MQLSLSVRIAEGFLSKERPAMGLEEVARLARRAGYDAICMRASQVGVHSTKKEVDRARQILAEHGLPVSMVTGDFDVVYNNERGPDGLRRIGKVLELARALAAPLVRVALKRDEDIRWAQRAADQAAELGVALVHQCHALSLFETVAGIEQTLAKINRPNFGLIFEPANLELCGQDYGPETIKRLRPWIFNVYLQNHVIKAEGSTTLETWCRGPVRFDLIPIHQSGGIALDRVADGLEQIGYDGTVTAHESAPPGSPPADCAVRAARFLRERFSRLTGE